MKKSLVTTLVTIVGSCVFSLNAQASPNCDDPTGLWVNELGSTLNIARIKPDGKIKGTYISPSGTTGDTYPLLGWTNYLPPNQEGHNARVITFSVRWGTYGSVTAWSGTCNEEDGTPAISTLWHLTRPNSDFVWDHIHTNSNVFIPKE